MKKIILAFCMLSIIQNANASEIFNTQIQNTISSNSEVISSQVYKSWDLSASEWIQYVQLIQGQAGKLYSKLTPPEVLGIFSESKEDLQHYAEIAAKGEHDRLERELRFNAAFHEAAAKLYVKEPLIKPFNFLPFTPIPKHE